MGHLWKKQLMTNILWKECDNQDKNTKLLQIFEQSQ